MFNTSETAGEHKHIQKVMVCLTAHFRKSNNKDSHWLYCHEKGDKEHRKQGIMREERRNNEGSRRERGRKSL